MPILAASRLGSAATVSVASAAAVNSFVVVGDIGDRTRQREHEVEVADRQQFGLALGKPFHDGGALTLGACRLRQLLSAMTVSAQSSQRATWPLSAIVRQRSIAGITFIWSRLTCPALALRHAAPWSRKASATSNAEQGTAAGCYAGGEWFRLFLGFL